MSFFASFFAKKEVLASFSGRGLAVTLLAFGLVVIGHVSLPLTMLVMLPVSLVMAWRL
jgi:hypothetical protein